VGDVASNVDPMYVGLPWAGIRLLLEVSVTDLCRAKVNVRNRSELISCFI